MASKYHPLKSRKFRCPTCNSGLWLYHFDGSADIPNDLAQCINRLCPYFASVMYMKDKDWIEKYAKYRPKFASTNES